MRPTSALLATGMRRALGHARRNGTIEYALQIPTEGFDVSSTPEHSPHDHVPGPDESAVPELEDDQTVAPRPEEEIADVLRAEPDVEDHSQHSE